MRSFLLLCFFALSGFLVNAQDNPYNWEIGLQAAASNYHGDLITGDVFTPAESKFVYGLLARYQLNPDLALRGNFFRGFLRGHDAVSQDAGRQWRQYSFSSTLTETSLFLEWEPWGRRRYGTTGVFKPVISPYLFGGIGGAFVDPKTDFFDRDIPETRADKAADLPGALFSTPFGAGIKFDLNDKFTVALEGGLRPVYNDYLDGVSRAANPDVNDWYSLLGANVVYRLRGRDSDRDGIVDKEDACPEIPGLAALGGCPDADGDGITDAEDQCPNAAGLPDLAGCPDTDGDGIADEEDQCPDIAGLPSLAGCPDADGDGITDAQDQCPNVAGLPNLAGCPDTDGDGITDAEDQCPDQPGRPAMNGCPDTDGDTIADPEDDCPNEAGPAANRGCPLPDADNDGVTDAEDACPDLPGPASNEGCPEVEGIVVKAGDLSVSEVIYFDFDSARLRPKSKEDLDKLVAIITAYPTHTLEMQGFTDNIGAEEYNRRLSERRAKACFDYLRGKGVSADRIAFLGFGEGRPAAENTTREGRQLNRRVEFEMRKN